VTKNAAASSLEMTAGEWAGKAITLAIMVSVFGAANSGFLSGTRVLYAMAGDGLGARRLAEVHERYGTPAWAVGVCGVWAALLAASGTFEQLLTYVVFAGGIFNVLGALALFVYRRRLPDLPRPFRVPGYPFSPLLFALAGIALTVNTIFGAPNEAAVGLGLIAVGVPVYLFMRRGAKPPPQRPSPDN
jgi:APA family basic amino acid/polyamine antiporter